MCFLMLGATGLGPSDGSKWYFPTFKYLDFWGPFYPGYGLQYITTMVGFYLKKRAGVRCSQSFWCKTILMDSNGRCPPHRLNVQTRIKIPFPFQGVKFHFFGTIQKRNRNAVLLVTVAGTRLDARLKPSWLPRLGLCDAMVTQLPSVTL